ncbi:MAG: WYL domain-containing protein [Sphingopyxis sp.]|nr:WYL domain-containing protein [Sphingopyxis sp.]
MDDTRLKLMEAIARKRKVTAQYNGQILTLAPHLLFERHGDLFVSALNLNKSWRSDENPRLGHFKLDGLASVTLIEEEFDPLPDFEPSPPREEDTPLLAV